ncbi:sensor histidine kinase [Lachnospiraceae bacterium KM106-2]|nr:sensor histidine kinase [Lachnospiraceae bacterium KM106-2]
MNAAKFIALLLAGIVQNLLFLRFLSVMWKKKENRVIWYIGIGFCIVLNCTLSVTNVKGVDGLTVITGILPSFLCGEVYEDSKRNRILLSVINIVLLNLCEIFAGMMTSLIFQREVSKIHSSVILFMVGILVSLYLYYCIVSFLIILVHKGQKKLSIPFIIAVLITPISFELVCILLSRFMYQSHDKKLILLSLGAVVLLIIATIFIFIMIDRQTALELEAQKTSFLKIQLKTQKDHYEELYRSQNDARKLYHDMKNSLIAITSMIEKDESHEAEEYITSLTGKVDELIKVVNTGIPALDGILQSKMNYAREIGAKIDYKLLLPEKLYMDEIELAVVIGILLDNAIEASSKLTDKTNKKIMLRINTRFKYLSIEIRNGVNEKVDVHSLETTKDDSLNHGFGLENAKAIVEKYDGDIQLHCDGQIFITQILLTNKCPK